MGAAISTTVLSSLKSFVCTDLTVHSECCSEDECCECDMDSHNASPSPAVEVEVKQGEEGYEVHLAKS